MYFVKASAVFCRAELIFKKALQIIAVCDIISRYLRCGADMLHKYGIAGMMELADVPDSKSTSPLHTALAETLDFARLFQN